MSWHMMSQSLARNTSKECINQLEGSISRQTQYSEDSNEFSLSNADKEQLA